MSVPALVDSTLTSPTTAASSPATTARVPTVFERFDDADDGAGA
jgi:hypothetical protein